MFSALVEQCRKGFFNYSVEACKSQYDQVPVDLRCIKTQTKSDNVQHETFSSHTAVSRTGFLWGDIAHDQWKTQLPMDHESHLQLLNHFYLPSRVNTYFYDYMAALFFIQFHFFQFFCSFPLNLALWCHNSSQVFLSTIILVYKKVLI
jgi:hypothetical protein